MGLIHRVNIGNAELIALQDSWAAMPPTAFFTTTDASDWDDYGELLDDDGNLTLNLGAWLVLSQGTTILVDSGIGGRPNDFPAKATPALPDVMREAGVSPDEIDIVAFTHLHFDHTGWNTTDVDGDPQAAVSPTHGTSSSRPNGTTGRAATSSAPRPATTTCSARSSTTDWSTWLRANTC